MRSFLISWLKKQYAGTDLASFAQKLPGDWLVWEAGPWRPPNAGRDTIVSGPSTRLLKAGESLVIALESRNGGAEIRLGRAFDNDLVVDDGTLSRSHLAFKKDVLDKWTVVDVGSSNGTRLNGELLGATAMPLEIGDRIEAGAVRLTFYDCEALYFRLRDVF